MAQPLKALLDDFFASNDSWHAQLLNAWPRIVGNIKTPVHVLKINQDTLTIGVTDSCWLQELYLLSPLLLTRINEQLDQPHVKKLRFQIMGLKKKGCKADSFIHFTEKTVVITAQEKQVLSSITDEQLRLVLERYLIRCHKER